MPPRPGRIKQGAAQVVDHLRVGRQHLGHRRVPGRGKVRGRAVSRCAGDRLAEVVDDELLNRVPDAVLGAVMMHQQPDRHAGRGGNRPHRGAVFALAGVQVERGVANPGLSRQVLIACAGVQLWRHRHLHLIIAVLIIHLQSQLYKCIIGYTIVQHDGGLPRELARSPSRYGLQAICGTASAAVIERQ